MIERGGVNDLVSRSTGATKITPATWTGRRGCSSGSLARKSFRSGSVGVEYGVAEHSEIDGAIESDVNMFILQMRGLFLRRKIIILKEHILDQFKYNLFDLRCVAAELPSFHNDVAFDPSMSAPSILVIRRRVVDALPSFTCTGTT